jgi:hypothetical protein
MYWPARIDLTFGSGSAGIQKDDEQGNDTERRQEEVEYVERRQRILLEEGVNSEGMQEAIRRTFPKPTHLVPTSRTIPPLTMISRICHVMDGHPPKGWDWSATKRKDDNMLTLQQAQYHRPQTESRHGEVKDDIVSGKHDPIRDPAQTFRCREVVRRLVRRWAFGFRGGEGVHLAEELCVVIVIGGGIVVVGRGSHGFWRNKEKRWCDKGDAHFR